MKRKRLVIFFLIILSIGLALYVTNIYFALRSYLIMYPFSYMEEKESILNKKGIEVYIPGGLLTRQQDWYPFVITFNDDKGFSRYTGKDLALTVLYNFGHFQLLDGSSSYYNPISPYYSSFYGAYVVYNNDNPDDTFGFDENGEVIIDELSMVPAFDQTKLVLPSLGCPEERIVFETTIDRIENVSYINMENWVMAESTITTNSPIHKYEKTYRGYIQYGKPLDEYYEGDDFPIIELKGRIYAKHIKEYNMTFVFYVLGPNIETIEKCDDNILSKSKISEKM